MPKNIIICCDGTDNKLTLNENTNVIHLYSCLKKNDEQLTYYHPGVGTIAPSGMRNAIIRNWYRLKDKVSASSLEDNVKDAYLFLMDHYEEGDKIFLFGFSRGAYTVRMLSGLIEMFGLLHKGNSGHLRYALEVYSKGDKLFKLANSFKSRFSRKVNIHFIGIWDTVVAMGGLVHFYKSFPYSRSLGIAKTVRHAVAIDERRKHYEYYEVSEKHKDCREVFFIGVHSDVGGSYPEEGLSKIAMEWMLGEASNHGLLLDTQKVNYYIYGKKSNYQKPNHTLAIHNSLTPLHRITDFIPRLRFSNESRFYKMNIDFRVWPKRLIKPDALIHESVFRKMNDSDYKPKNIKLKDHQYTIEKTKRLKF